MKKFSFSKLQLAMVASSAICCSPLAIASDFFADSTLDVKWKVNYYDIQMEPDANWNTSVNGVPGEIKVDDVSIEDSGTSVWLNWQSGWIADTIGVEIEPQLAYAFDQSGTTDGSFTVADYVPYAGGTTIDSSTDNPYYYMTDADQHSIGKIGNANLRFKFGTEKNETQFMIGRFTPSIYDLLHRPDEIYYGMHQVYEGINVEGHYEWSWGMITPWVRYMTGYSGEYNLDTVRFKDDLDDDVGYGSFDEIINVGFHTETDYYTSSASFSYAPDYQSNGIIEIYSGIPYSTLGLGDAAGDKKHYVKYMVKYGAEDGLGNLNDDHSTDVYEFAVGLVHGDLDFLIGMSQIGDESFRGFLTQDNGYSAGGGTAIWGDVAILNTFDNADQRTFFLTGGYNVTPKWRVQGVVAHARNTDLDTLRNDDNNYSIFKENYTEVNLDIVYGENGYQGEGMSYLLKLGQDNNFNAFGFGLFLEYNGDLMNFL